MWNPLTALRAAARDAVLDGIVDAVALATTETSQPDPKSIRDRLTRWEAPPAVPAAAEGAIATPAPNGRKSKS